MDKMVSGLWLMVYGSYIEYPAKLIGGPLADIDLRLQPIAYSLF